MVKKIAVFASGSGSNAENLIKFFKNKSDKAKVELVLCNNYSAKVIKRCDELDTNCFLFKKQDLEQGKILRILQSEEIDFIVLAGFLLKIPIEIIEAFPNKIVNIHPSLLPKFGGKQMYGDKVHRAVLEAKESVSGITIHYVDNVYDNGKIIFQKGLEIEKNEDECSLAKKINVLELLYFPQVVESLL